MPKSLNTFTKESIKVLQNAIQNNKLVIFVGAGVSRNSEVAPCWNELIKKMAKGLCIEKEKFTYDDYMKIPQYYFNERGEKEYNDKVRELLKADKDLQPNSIHDLLFSLNPQHIITTNYDDLLEKTAKEKKVKFSKIKDDKDLSQSNRAKFIVKMHGEFNNIVLKEDDYDSYSNNFKLIETFVKGLFATNVILFVGCSGDDSNVRQIFQWVKDILDDKHQPAYFIEIDDKEKNKDGIKDEEFRVKFDYYRKKGINKLHYSQVKAEIEEIYKNFDEKEKKDLAKLKSDKGQNLYKFLKFIKKYTEETNILEDVHEKLSLLDPLNIISSKDIQSVLKDYISSSFNSNAYLENNNESKSLIKKFKSEEPSDFDKKLIKSINNKLYNAGIRELIYNSNDEYILFKPDNSIIDIPDSLVYIREFSYSKLNSVLELQSFKNNDDLSSVNIFEKAYLLFKLEKFIEAYMELKRISFEADKNNNYLIYVLAEFNKKQVGLHIEHKYSLDDQENEEYAKIREIVEEYKKIDLDFIISNYLPEDYKKLIKELTESIFNFSEFKDIYIKMIASIKQIKETKEIIKKGGGSFNNAINDLYNKMKETLSIINYNFFFIGNYKEIKDIFYTFIDGILMSYSIDPSKPSMFPVSRVKSFDYMDLYIMIEYIKSNDLKKLFESNNTKSLKLDEEKPDSSMQDPNEQRITKKILLEAYSNLINSLIALQLNEQSYKKIANFLLVFEKIELSKEEITDILEKYLSVIDKSKYFDWDKFSRLNSFIVNLYEKNKELLSADIVKKTLDLIFNDPDLIKLDKQKRAILKINKTVNNCAFIITKLDENYKINNNYINSLIKTDSIDKEAFELLIKIFNLLTEDKQELFRKNIY